MPDLVLPPHSLYRLEWADKTDKVLAVLPMKPQPEFNKLYGYCWYPEWGPVDGSERMSDWRRK